MTILPADSPSMETSKKHRLRLLLDFPATISSVLYYSNFFVLCDVSFMLSPHVSVSVNWSTKGLKMKSVSLNIFLKICVILSPHPFLQAYYCDLIFAISMFLEHWSTIEYSWMRFFFIYEIKSCELRASEFRMNLPLLLLYSVQLSIGSCPTSDCYIYNLQYILTYKYT